MTTWARRIRGALGLGLTWAVGWAIAGIMIGVASNVLPGLPWHLFFDVFDAPLPALAVPGFFAGACFSIVLGVAGRRRRFHELSLGRFTTWGAAGGLLLALLPFAIVGLGLGSTEGSSIPLWQGVLMLAGPFVLLSALSAAASFVIAQRGESRQELEGGQTGQLGEGDAHDVIGVARTKTSTR